MERSHTYSTLTASESVLGRSTHTHSRTLFSSTLRYSVCIQFLCYVFSIRLSLSESQHFYVADMDKSNAQFILNGCTQVPIWIRKLVSKSFEQKNVLVVNRSSENSFSSGCCRSNNLTFQPFRFTSLIHAEVKKCGIGFRSM